MFLHTVVHWAKTSFPFFLPACLGLHPLLEVQRSEERQKDNTCTMTLVDKRNNYRLTWGRILSQYWKWGKHRAKSKMREKKRSEQEEVSQDPRAISLSVIFSPPQTWPNLFQIQCQLFPICPPPTHSVCNDPPLPDFLFRLTQFINLKYFNQVAFWDTYDDWESLAFTCIIMNFIG